MAEEVSTSASSSQLGPRQTVVALKSSSSQGHDVSTNLSERSQSLKFETIRSSAKSVASGLRCWHLFAVNILAYNVDATLSHNANNTPKFSAPSSETQEQPRTICLT